MALPRPAPATRSLRPAELAELARGAYASLAQRSVSGLYAQVLLGALVVATSPLERIPLAASLGAAAWVAALGVARAWVARSFDRLHDAHTGRWSALFRGGVLLSAATWGAGSAALLLLGRFEGESWLVLLVLAGVCSGALSSLAADSWSLRGHLILSLAPLLAIAPFMPTTARAAACLVLVVLVFGGFLWIQGAAAHAALSKAAIDAKLLERHVRELEVARADALEAARAKAEFLANMGHEIRTPMTAIQGYAELLLDPTLGEHDRVGHARTIRRNSDHLLQLLDDILDLSRIEAGKLPLHLAPCSPAEIALEVATVMRARAAEKRLDLEVVLDTPIPAHVQSDAARLRQILVNLVGNAVKFTEKGSVLLRVRCLEPASDRPRLAFEVKDTGIGLTKEQVEGLFEPFSQVDASSTRKYGGTGLGLSICSRLAVALGGEIRVTSTPGEGSSFTVEVDAGSLKGVTMVNEIAEKEEERRSTLLPTVRLGGRVLVAEDGRDNQVLIGTYLRKLGVSVTIVEDGRAAVETAVAARAGRDTFDLILMDMQMPRLDGYDAAAELRRLGYDGAIVALTAHALPGDREKCLAAGCDDYLTKPIDRAKLGAAVRTFLERAGTATEDTLTSSRNPLAGEPLRSELEGDPDIADILVDFVSALPPRVSALQAALASHDEATLQRVAHQLKGAAGGYGFPSITEAARDLEAAFAAPIDWARVRKETDALCALCLRARIALAS